MAPLSLLSRIAPADATRGEQEPIHEYSFTIVIGIVSQQPVPLVFLFASTIAGTSVRADFPETKLKSITVTSPWRHNLRTHFLVYGLLEVLRVDYGPYFPGGVRCPVRRDYLHFALAGVNPETFEVSESWIGKSLGSNSGNFLYYASFSDV